MLPRGKFQDLKTPDQLKGGMEALHSPAFTVEVLRLEEHSVALGAEFREIAHRRVRRI